jgi:hypothetical protein
LAAIACEYCDAIRFVKPPATIQAMLFGPLGAIARRIGRDSSQQTSRRNGSVRHPRPGRGRPRHLLARPVGTRAARRRG